MTGKVSAASLQEQLNATQTISGARRSRETSDFDNLPKELSAAIKDVYLPAGMKVTNAFEEQESKDYGACRLDLDDRKVVFRVAKTTPKKVGQFVTVWQRPREGTPYVPFNVSDGVEFIVVSVSDATHTGQFVFDKKVLVEQGIMGSADVRGKGAFRVYSPWSKPENKTAIKTKEWQIRYFLSQNTLDLDTVRRLFRIAVVKH